MNYELVEDLLADFGGDSRFDPPTDRSATLQEDAGEAEVCPSKCEDDVAELEWLREYANPRGSTIDVKSSARVKSPEMASNNVVNEGETRPANTLPAPVLQDLAAQDENTASAAQGQQAIGQAAPEGGVTGTVSQNIGPAEDVGQANAN